MLDKQKDQGDRQEVTEAKAAPEVQKNAVIGDTGNQARWNRAQQAHYLGQDESATDLFHEPSQKKQGVQKFELFDSSAEPEPAAIVAWDPIKWAGEKAGEVKEAAAKNAEKAWYPFRGKEDSQVDYSACANAYKAFPEFSKHPNIDRALIPALIRNELHFYNAKEGPIEGVLNTFGDLPSDSLSVGPAQMKQSNIERLMAKFPQLSSPEHGSITGNPTKAALDPAKAPWFVAAYLAEQIQSHDSAKLPVTHQELIQKYNPGGRVHYNHVHEQLIWIKTNHAGW